MRNLWSLVHHRSIHIHKQDKNTHTRYKHTHTHTHTHTRCVFVIALLLCFSCSRCRDYTRALTCTQTHNEYLQNNEEHSSSSLVPQAEPEGQTPWLETYTYEHRHALAWSLSGYSLRSVAAGLRRRGEEGKECCAQNALLARAPGAPPCDGGTVRWRQGPVYSQACHRDGVAPTAASNRQTPAPRERQWKKEADTRGCTGRQRRQTRRHVGSLHITT